MAVPSNVIDRINRLEKAQKRVLEARSNDRDLQARRREVQEEMNKRRSDILEFAGEIFLWREAIVKSREGQRLWSLIGGARVPLIAFWFWDGLPITPDNPFNACTQVSLDGPNHHFLIEEWRDGLPYREIGRPTAPIQIMDMAHPKMIDALMTFLTGPEGWQPITDELESRLKRYETR